MPFAQDARCRFIGRSNCLYSINVHVPLPRTPDAGSPDKIIRIFLWLLLRTPDAGSPADPIVFAESMFMFLYPGRQMPVRRIKLLEYFCAFTQDAGCRFAGRSNCLYRINVHVPLSRTPDAGSPDKIIRIFLCLLLRMSDIGSPADPIVFTESIFMFLYPGRQMPVCRIKSLEYSCGFYSGRQMPDCQIKSLYLE